jgi:hypothetical protein
VESTFSKARNTRLCAREVSEKAKRKVKTLTVPHIIIGFLELEHPNHG